MIRPPADPEEATIGRPTPTARRLVDASVSANTRRAYAGALGQLDAWLAGRPLDDAALAAYLAELHDAGRAASSAAMAVAAAAVPGPARRPSGPVRRADRPSPRRPGQSVQRRGPGGRARHPRATLPRRRGRGVESDQVAAARGRLDAVIAGLLFMGGLRRSEVSALRRTPAGGRRRR